MPMWRRSTSTPYDIDLMDEDAAETTPAPAPRLCSTIAGGGDDGGVEVGLHRVDDVLAELHQAEGLVDDRSCSRPGAGGGVGAPHHLLVGHPLRRRAEHAKAAAADAHDVPAHDVERRRAGWQQRCRRPFSLSPLSPCSLS
uniref:DUF834 domain-containing protein n=1 Tax=Oryza nivara TaxID=4536 RepID=A0A0E0G6T2_ORYNI